MNLNDLTTLEDVEAFLEGTRAVVFEVGGSKAERYRWIEETLKRKRPNSDVILLPFLRC